MGAPMDEVLRTREIIPPVTGRTADGAVVRAWDYKQKRNLVIAFLHADSSELDKLCLVLLNMNEFLYID